MKNVVILGASKKERRYSYKAMNMLKEHGYNPYPVNPAYEEIEGITCYSSLEKITDEIHTVAMYMNSERSTPLIGSLISLKPKRIIINPGTENDELEKKASENGIEVLRACTLVMLSTGQF